MKQILQKLYDIRMQLLNYLKWLYFIAYPMLYNYGLDNYFILDALWFIAGAFIAKDLYIQYKEEKQRKEEDSKE